MAFMFETRFPQRVTRYAAELDAPLQDDYIDCWAGLKKHFDPDEREAAVTRAPRARKRAGDGLGDAAIARPRVRTMKLS